MLRLAVPHEAAEQSASTPEEREREQKRRRWACRPGDARTARAPGAALPSGNARTALLAALSALSAYAALRLTIRAFHTLRRRALRRLLLDLSPALDAAGATHWLDYGSLLGLHRDGDLILHDNDIDLVVIDPDWPRLHEHLSAALPQYAVRVLTPSEDATLRFVRVYTPIAFADIFSARVSACGARVIVELGHDDEAAALPAAAVLPPRRLAFRGAAVPAPRDVEAALAARYGGDWRTPRYMDKGADTVEAAKLYARIFRGLAWAGIRL